MSKPTFVLVHGAFHTSAVYDGLRMNLAAHGYPSVAVSLPSVGANPPHYDFAGDVAAIRDAVTQLVEQGRNVVVVMHSYSGLPGGEALKGLGKKERAGLRGGLLRLVFVMAWIVPAGFQLAPRNTPLTKFSFLNCDIENGTVTVSSSDSKEAFYNDLSPVAQGHWASRLRPQSIGVFWSKTTYAAWCYIPTTYVLCENDQGFTLAYAKELLRTAREVEPNGIDCVERCGAGHFPFLSRERWMLDVLRRAAGEDATVKAKL